MKHLFHGNTKTDSNQFCQTICEEKNLIRYNHF